MPRLLISVRNAAEAADALAAGADLIDVKEPHRGALGAAEPETIRAVLAAVDGRVPTSIALGELSEGNRVPDTKHLPTFAKFGLSGAAHDADWRAQFERAIAELPSGVQPVAVAYVDWREAAAPAPREVLDIAIGLSCRGLLLDTFGKTGGSLTSHVNVAELGELLSRARQAGLITVLAGGLQLHELEVLAALEPDYFGFRGAVCRGGRESTLNPERVRELCDRMRTTGRMSASGARRDDAACSR